MDTDKEQQIHYGDDYHYIPATSVASGKGVELKADVYAFTTQIANLVAVGLPATDSFVLVDAGMPNSADEILSMTRERFGPHSRPRAIILTHAHFDHVGGLVDLIREWQVPVYAHPDELPYLTGEKSYPKPDPTVEGGVLAKLSFAFPNEPLKLSSWVHSLPDDGTVPGLPDFRWLHTPGHTPGHVSFFREKDRMLIAGDAFITVRQDQLYSVLTQKMEISGPPRYFTPDWEAARDSVKKLEALRPAFAVTGHGIPVSGVQLTDGLHILAQHFDELAVPDYGIYAPENHHKH
ncbi:MBL fold metallo-hydrolase [Paenibacillus dokdonensis]|uniref:MBL fold metallo-hydrolase n=1 Tax=Paenibacillus dokdonensis TaxID=2567944 RepID=A0ABU6GU62_9BACL|nr:MBL fold metallo-hydrolase [Paenibacillus dokdonensis]MEC0242260.1 MBL fold metallo-hydrolase [Paenibacillus dokdonensis]